MRRIDQIIVHCTATPAGRETSVDEIRRWHLQRGFSDIGYHFVIGLDGCIEDGRPIEKIGAHCKGKNRHSIGICYVGGMDKEMKNWVDTRTPEQCLALEELLWQLKGLFPHAGIYGHNNFSTKACPSFDAVEEYKHITNQNDAHNV